MNSQSFLNRANWIFPLLLMLAMFARVDLANADDTEIYTNLETCDAVPPEKYRFIFIVDNSGSMSTSEFTASKATIDAAAASLLNGELNDPDNPDDMKLAVVQYGSVAYELISGRYYRRDAGDIEHLYDVTVPFTDSVATAQNWGRHFGYQSSAAVPLSGEDHQPAALTKMRQDNVYASGGALDVSTRLMCNLYSLLMPGETTGVVAAARCLSTIATVGMVAWISMMTFGEYDALKDGSVLPNGLKGQFTILHVPPNNAAGSAAAAIASPGGDYVGNVEYNAGDPEGPGRDA